MAGSLGMARVLLAVAAFAGMVALVWVLRPRLDAPSTEPPTLSVPVPADRAVDRDEALRRELEGDEAP